MQVASQSLQSQVCRPAPTRKLRRGPWIHASAQTITGPVHPAPGQNQQEGLNMLRSNLLREVAGLDRGLAASASQAKRVEALVQEIVDTRGQPDLSQEHTADLQGMWRLLYTSGFNTGSLGGSRPGPPAGLVPAVLGQIFQRIDAPTGKLDNIVEFIFITPPPFSRDGDTPALRLTLGHDYQVLSPSTVEIVFEDTSAEVVGGLSFLPKLTTPTLPEFLRPSKNLRSAKFEVLYLDTEFRITRGDRGELRIYAKEKP
uniref:Plastid lipid-associated protein/fibrillin conserved domain-containing protein n=1 Tax=Dunaliella tertiolecta TaxID=3047 RepID=A0A7S3R5X9_DUNTE|mmetsp:Transcript_19289/g.54009  ORF Transcript_19289/g.54009 Transcript_19289/m.54009 type:complete len:257 (+) Transcript_19289:207-977(+)